MCMPLRSLWESTARSSGRSLVPQTQGRSWRNLSDEFKACIACKDLNKGRALHAKLVSSGEVSNIYVTNRLINMYAKCGSIDDAKKVFDSMSSRNTASWNTLMLGYVENGDGSHAMRMYQQMHEQREKNRWCSPDSRTYVAALKACSWLAEREQGEQIQGRIVKLKALENEYLLHSRAAEYGFVTDIFVASSLVGTYVKCGSVADARRAFDRMPVRDVVSWTALMLGYAESGDWNEALKLFEQMKSSGVEANSRTFLAALKACISLARNTEGRVAALAQGRAIHSELENQCETDIFVANTLVDMYAKCGSIAESRQVFDSMLTRTVVTWTAMMLGYVESGDGESALELFSRMDSAPNAFTFATALKACSCIAECEEGHVKIQSLARGMEIHSKLVGREGLLEDLFVANTLVDMYAKCGSVFDARKSFDQMVKHDIVSWNALLLNCEEEVGLELYLAMQATGITPDSRSFVAILKACTSLAEGRSVHFEARRRGVAGDMFVASMLVEMYAKCGSIEEAREVFESMEQRDVVSWTCLMMGYAECGEGATALKLFARMRSEECVPNVRTFLALLKACGTLVALDLTKAVHSVICCMGLTDHSILVNSLVDIYIRCGSVMEAEYVFHLLPTRDLVAWNTLLAGYSRLGDTERVSHGFHGILGEGHQVNDVTFVCLLTACSHAGLVEKAQRVFRVMQLEYGILPCFDHYTCLIDALGRANRLQEAIKVVEGMPFGPSVVTWRTVLAACVKWKNLGVAKVAFQELVRVEERDVAGYSLMGNLYASLEMWEEHAKLGLERFSSRFIHF